MPDRDSVLQAGVLLFTLTVELTQAAVETLGAGNSGNRQVQILLALHSRSGLTPSRAWPNPWGSRVVQCRTRSLASRPRT